MKFNYIFVSIALIILSLSKIAAQEDIVNWSFEIENIDDKKVLKATANIKNGWFIYSQHIEDGPIPTSFKLKQASVDAFTAVTLKEETTPIKIYSELFEAEVLKFKGEAIFTISVDDYKSGDIITGSVMYMSCDKSKCLPPRSVDFEVKI